MKLIMTMIFMKIPLKFQVLLQQSCLVDGGLNIQDSSYDTSMDRGRPDLHKSVPSVRV